MKRTIEVAMILAVVAAFTIAGMLWFNTEPVDLFPGVPDEQFSDATPVPWTPSLGLVW